MDFPNRISKIDHGLYWIVLLTLLVGIIVFIPVSHIQAETNNTLAPLAAGTWHSLALKSDGTVWAWGRNDYGQLGNGSKTNRSIPVQVQVLSEVISVAAGNAHSLALKSDGTVWAWGYNYDGELGDGTQLDRSIPVQVQGLSNVVALSGGGAHNLALKSDGTVWAWGYNYYGQLGDGTHDNFDGIDPNKYIPVQVKGLNGINAIAAGSDHSLALKSDGTVWAWGHNYYGQLGDQSTASKDTPVQVQGINGVKALASEDDCSLALKTDGTVWDWGRNQNGSMGDYPIQVPGISDIRALDGGYLHRLYLKNDATVLEKQYSSYLAQVPGLSEITAINAGGYNGLALKGDGTVWSWGDNSFGQVGDGTQIDRSSPVQVHGPGNIGYLNLGVTQYTITVSSVGGHCGISISPGFLVPLGTDVSIAITPDTGYQIASITDDELKPIQNPYTISNVTKNHDVVVEIKPISGGGSDEVWIFDGHTHSKYSDGYLKTIKGLGGEFLEDVYLKYSSVDGAGLAVTDHSHTKNWEGNEWADRNKDIEDQDTGCVIIPGEEVNIEAGHFLVYGLQGLVSHFEGQAVETAIKAVGDQGGFGYIAHPNGSDVDKTYYSWTNSAWKQTRDLISQGKGDLIKGIEAISGGKDQLASEKGLAWNDWQVSAMRGQRMNLIGGSDYHGTLANAIMPNIGSSFTYLLLHPSTGSIQAEIMHALESGHTVASNGPFVNLTVETADGGKYIPGDTLNTRNGEQVTLNVHSSPGKQITVYKCGFGKISGKAGTTAKFIWSISSTAETNIQQAYVLDEPQFLFAKITNGDKVAYTSPIKIIALDEISTTSIQNLTDLDQTVGVAALAASINETFTSAGQGKTGTLTIDPATLQATVALSWPGNGDYNLTLIKPDGIALDTVKPAFGYSYEKNSTGINYVIDFPQPGNWTYIITAMAVPLVGEEVTLVMNTVPETPPAVNLAGFGDGINLTGPVTVTASANDADGLNRFHLFLNNEEMVNVQLTSGQVTAATSYNLDPSTLPDGAYTLTAWASDNNFTVSTQELKFIVDRVPPQAEAGLDVTVIVGKRAAVDGSGSQDASYYRWAFGDGNSTGNIYPGSANVYTQIGEYTVTLTVTDDAGNTSTDTLKVTVTDNTQAVTEFVTRFYQLCLNRAPDQGGLDYWVNQLKSGQQTGADVAYGFVFSNEFQDPGVTDQEYLRVLYKAFFNREADSGGLAYWSGILTGGTSRLTVLANFVNSNEFTEICDNYAINRGSIDLTSEQITAFVTRFYQLCLSREPDQGGLNYWVNQLKIGAQTGADLSQGFVFSLEFEAQALNNSDFLAVMYRAFFDREPDSGGLAYWQDQMEGGMSRLGVLANFVNSAEFAAICSDYGIVPGVVNI